MKFLYPKCNKSKCPFFGDCTSLPTEYYLIDNKIKFFFVGQGGGRDEKKKKRPFIGRAGKRLKQIIKALYEKEKFGIAFSNTVRCCPVNHKPKEAEKYCLYFLKKDIKTLYNKYELRNIILLGNKAKNMFFKTQEKMSDIHGQIKHYEHENVNVMATYHPFYLLRKNAGFDINNEYDNMVYNDILSLI